MVVYHIVLLKLKEDYDRQTLAQVLVNLKAFVGTIPGVLTMECGNSLGIAEMLPYAKGYNWAAISTVDKPSSIPGYMAHEGHTKLQPLLMTLIDDIIVLDFEV